MQGAAINVQILVERVVLQLLVPHVLMALLCLLELVELCVQQSAQVAAQVQFAQAVERDIT